MIKLLFGRVLSYVGIAIIASTILGGAYWGWKRQIEQQALLEYNQQQLEQIIKDQELFYQKMAVIEQKQQEILNDLDKKNREIAIKLKDLEKYLNSPEVKKLNRPASEIIKNTIRKLGE